MNQSAIFIRHQLRLLLLIFCLQYITNDRVYSLQNNIGAHDPSSIIKYGDTYWIFTTGNGIYSIYSKDLIKWTAGVTPFTQNEWPGWITAYVPDFAGHFWAPECVFMNGKYYLYYSCSFWGVRKSVIGLATNVTLDPASPEYEWVDEGMVVYSNENTDVNCIDPSIFKDAEGRLWMSYGSYFGGIRITELDLSTGKPLNSTRFAVASGDCEASYVVRKNNYYYLFINRGTCCDGINSTYHIQVGRSESPTGPFLDQDGIDLNEGGGTTILSASENFIGPGCFGYYEENSTEWASYHYYDGNMGGMATLGLANIQWDNANWPYITREWLPDGLYSIAGLSNLYVWENNNCEIFQNNDVVQGFYQYNSCQQWFLKNLGNGYYSINTSEDSLSVILEDCLSAAGTNLVIGPYEGEPCNIWLIERTAGGVYSIASKYGNRVASLSTQNNTIGTPIELRDYAGNSTQLWVFSDTSQNITTVSDLDENRRIDIFPNPYSKGDLQILISNTFIKDELIIIAQDGKIVYRQELYEENSVTIQPCLLKGLYTVYLAKSGIRKKLAVL